jgi:hypothetical protein
MERPKKSIYPEEKTFSKELEQLDRRVKTLEEKKLKTAVKKIIGKIRNFIVLHKKIFLIICLFAACSIVWETYMICLYKQRISRAAEDQVQSQFEEAGLNLLEAKKITDKSLILFMFRSNSIKNMIKLNTEREENYATLVKPSDSENSDTKDSSSFSNKQEVESKSDQTQDKTEVQIKEEQNLPLNTQENPAITESYKYSDYYPIILSFSDNLGNVIKTSQYNNYSGFTKYQIITTNTLLKIGDQITLTILAKDPQNREIYYSFSSNSEEFNNIYGIKDGEDQWWKSNSITYTISSKDIQTAGETLRIVGDIKVDKENLRFPSGGYDDSVFLDYILSPDLD